LLAQQSDWLAPARARLLRRVQIAQRCRILDLGCGWQTVTAELVRRSSGTVVAADSSRRVFAAQVSDQASILPVRCDAERLPFRPESFDLVFCQFALLWFDVAAAICEIRRVLAPGGKLVALEPDYGGLIEFPDDITTADLWVAALARAGADPHVGRRLPGVLTDAGFETRVDLLDRLTPPSPVRFDLLRGLPLTDDENKRLDKIIAADRACKETRRVVHLPVFLVEACQES
jgi:SAM-dependent methyltransferase